MEPDEPDEPVEPLLVLELELELELLVLDPLEPVPLPEFEFDVDVEFEAEVEVEFGEPVLPVEFVVPVPFEPVPWVTPVVEVVAVVVVAADDDVEDELLFLGQPSNAVNASTGNTRRNIFTSVLGTRDRTPVVERRTPPPAPPQRERESDLKLRKGSAEKHLHSWNEQLAAEPFGSVRSFSPLPVGEGPGVGFLSVPESRCECEGKEWSSLGGAPSCCGHSDERFQSRLGSSVTAPMASRSRSESSRSRVRLPNIFCKRVSPWAAIAIAEK